MTEQEKKIFIDCLIDTVNCTTDTVYESLALLFEEMAKHPELTLQQTLIAMSTSLKMIVEKKKENKNESILSK